MKKQLLSAVFGLGLIALATPSFAAVNAQTGTTYTFVNSDCDPNHRTTVTFSNSGAVAVTLPQAGGSGNFNGDCVIQAENLGSGTVTITPTTSTVNGQTTLVLPQYASAWITNTATSVATGNYLALTGLSASGAQSLASITGTADPFPIVGLGAAQGGAVSVTAGASTTSGNAGGPLTLVGGAGGATGIGGAASLTGAAGQGNAVGGAATVTAGAGAGTGAGAIAGLVGGAGGTGGATGNGGVARVVGGASVATNGTGGAGQLTGGAGIGSGAGGAAATLGGTGGATGAGGAATVTGGTGGATSGTGGALTLASGAAGATTGVGGAVSMTAGASTSGAGAAVTITAAAGAAGTNAGGNVNLVPGAAVSTGIPGNVQVNADSNLIYATYYFTGTPAATNQAFFIATRPMIVISCSEVHSTAAGSTSTLTVEKDTTTAAPGSGTSLHQSGSFNLNATANTVQTASISTTIATAKLATGDRLAVVFANAIQSSVGVVVSCGMAPL